MRVVPHVGEEQGWEQERQVAMSCSTILGTEETPLTEEVTSTQVSGKHLEAGDALVGYLTSSNLVKLSASLFPHL